MIGTKELVAEVEKEILSAHSPSVPVLRVIRKNISRKIRPWDRQIVIEAALASLIVREVTRKLGTGRKDGGGIRNRSQGKSRPSQQSTRRMPKL
jgi:hypothetical protein